MCGVIISEIGQIILICCTIFPLIATSLLCLTQANLNNLTPFFPHGIGNLFSATKIVIFGFMGFECAASLFNIVKNPAQNVPRALTYAIIAVGALYLLFISSIILSIPLDFFTHLRIPLTDILATIFPNNRWVLMAIHFSILSAIIGTLHSMIWSSSSLLLIYFKKIHNVIISKLIASGVLNEYASIIIIGICIFMSFITLKNPDLFFSFAAILIVGAYASAMIALLSLNSEWKSGQNIKTIIGLGTAGLIMYFALHSLIAMYI